MKFHNLRSRKTIARTSLTLSLVLAIPFSNFGNLSVCAATEKVDSTKKFVSKSPHAVSPVSVAELAKIGMEYVDTRSVAGSSQQVSEYRIKKNGLSILLSERHVTPVATVMMVYHVGSRNEAVGYTGSTHFLEHMMFKGTTRHDPLKGTGLDDVLKPLGGYNNATTSYDRTNYFEVVSSKGIDTCLDLESDRMRHLLLRKSDHDAEMTVVRNELERGEDEPSEILMENLFASGFREHPYHHPVIGWRSDVENVPIQRLRQFYDDFYWPNNATLIVIGDFQTLPLLKSIAEKFGTIPRSPKPFPTVYTQEPKQEGPRRFVVQRGSEQPRVILGWHGVSAKDADDYPLDLLESILGDDSKKSSRLYRALVDTGLASEVDANNTSLHDPGMFMLMATPSPHVKPEEMEKLLKEQIQKVIDEPVTQAELDRAKQSVLKRIKLSSSDPVGMADQLTEAISLANWQWLSTYPEKIRAVTANDIQRAARKYFTDNNSTVGYYIPKTPPTEEKVAGGDAPTANNAPGAAATENPPKDYAPPVTVPQSAEQKEKQQSEHNANTVPGSDVLPKAPAVNQSTTEPSARPAAGTPQGTGASTEKTKGDNSTAPQSTETAHPPLEPHDSDAARLSTVSETTEVRSMTVPSTAGRNSVEQSAPNNTTSAPELHNARTESRKKLVLAQPVHSTKPSKSGLSHTEQNANSGRFSSQVKRTVLPNGLTIVTMPIKGTGTVAVSGRVRAGEYFKEPDKSLVPGLMAEELTTGTTHRTKEQIAQELESLGASLNFNSDEFWLSFNSEVTVEDLDKFLPIAADALMNPVFAPEELAKTKKVKLSGLKDAMVDTGSVSYNQFARAWYKPNSVYYNKTFQDQINELATIDASDLKRFHSAHVTPANTIITVVGDITPEQAARVANNAFAGWTGDHKDQLQIDQSVLLSNPIKGTITSQIPDKANADVVVGHPVNLTFASKDYFPTMIGNAALGYDSFACRLAPVRDKYGLTYSISSSLSAEFPYAPWAISYSVNPKNYDRTLSLVRQIVGDYLKSGITPAELEKEKSHLEGAFFVGLRGPRQIANKLCELEILGPGAAFIDQFPTRIRSVTQSQVNECIRRYFTLSDAVVSASGSLKGGETAPR